MIFLELLSDTNSIEGQIVDSKTKVSSDVSWIREENDSLQQSFPLFSYCYDIPPELNFDVCKSSESLQQPSRTKQIVSAVIKVGDIHCDFSSVDLSKFKSKTRGGRKLYQLQYRVEALLGNDEGELQFRILSGGKELGAATIEYENQWTAQCALRYILERL